MVAVGLVGASIFGVGMIIGVGQLVINSRADATTTLTRAPGITPSSISVPSASAAPPLAEYKAPLGLTWGQSPKDAKAILSKRLTFRREYTDKEGTIEQTYVGQFAGTDPEMIGVDFSVKDGLFGVVAVYPAADERPASKRWEDLTEKMRAEYGEPAQFNAPPKTQAEAVAEAYPETGNKAKIVTLMGAASPGRYEELDAKIVKGDWAPSAIWGFSNAAVLVLVNDIRDANGHHALKPYWFFGTKDGLKQMSKSAPREF